MLEDFVPRHVDFLPACPSTSVSDRKRHSDIIPPLTFDGLSKRHAVLDSAFSFRTARRESREHAYAGTAALGAATLPSRGGRSSISHCSVKAVRPITISAPH